MPNIEIKETEYYNCPYCHRIIPDYTICSCVKIYNQALENMANKLKSKPYWDDEHYFQAIPIGFIDEVLEELIIK